MMMSSYTANRANLFWEEGWYSSPRLSCSVMYAFIDSSKTILITCHHKFKSHISADTVLSEYPNHLLHHVNSDHFYLSVHYTHIVSSSENNILTVWTLANRLAWRPQCAINSMLTTHLTKTLRR